MTAPKAANEELLAPVHPGEILLHEFLEPMGLSQDTLAKRTGLPTRLIGEIVRGDSSVTAETALRLGRYFGMDARFSGSGCRPAMISMSPRMRSVIAWRTR